MKDFPAYGKGTQGKLVRQKQKEDPYKLVPLVMALVIFLGVAMFFVVQRVEYIATERGIKALMFKKREIIEATLPLKLEAGYLTRLNRVESIAKRKLGMINPASFRIITPPEPKIEPLVDTTPKVSAAEIEKKSEKSQAAGQKSKTKKAPASKAKNKTKVNQ
ncbi:MAG: cell division protein FtsL [SAR324 cluster bacterium]|nr:cell division protein FtsL [SAR324 cluster bacterium]